MVGTLAPRFHLYTLGMFRHPKGYQRVACDTVWFHKGQELQVGPGRYQRQRPTLYPGLVNCPECKESWEYIEWHIQQSQK